MTRVCEAGRTGRGDVGCNIRADFDVVYRNVNRTKILTRTPACFAHGLAEVDRALAAGTMAEVDLEPAEDERQGQDETAAALSDAMAEAEQTWDSTGGEGW